VGLLRKCTTYVVFIFRWSCVTAAAFQRSRRRERLLIIGFLGNCYFKCRCLV
jgi:hypothetical protein